MESRDDFHIHDALFSTRAASFLQALRCDRMKNAIAAEIMDFTKSELANSSFTEPVSEAKKQRKCTLLFLWDVVTNPMIESRCAESAKHPVVVNGQHDWLTKLCMFR